MKITNNLGLPEALVMACQTSPHNSPNSVSATTLLKGVREIVLTKRHWGEMTDDVSNRIWALFGTAVHSLLEHETPDTFTEEFLSVAVSGWRVTGRIDCYDMTNGIVHDYKTASVWKVIKGDFEDWRKQGLTYAWLLKENGFPVSECRFTALLKDHSKSKARHERGYPQTPVYVYQFTVTDEDLKEIEGVIRAKVIELDKCNGLADDQLPMCTDSERWAKPTTWAVMKEGRKTALRVFEDKELADKYLEGIDDKKAYIEERKGTDGKCPEYCSCCAFCDYWKKNYGGNEAVAE